MIEDRDLQSIGLGLRGGLRTRTESATALPQEEDENETYAQTTLLPPLVESARAVAPRGSSLSWGVGHSHRRQRDSGSGVCPAARATRCSRVQALSWSSPASSSSPGTRRKPCRNCSALRGHGVQAGHDISGQRLCGGAEGVWNLGSRWKAGPGGCERVPEGEHWGKPQQATQLCRPWYR